MRICGLNKMTLLDYPGRVACTIFIGGCNYRCPFCQNGSLVLTPMEEPEIQKEEIFAFLKKRQGILDGVAITGGEPTLSPGLPEFMQQIRDLGYDIKLDTNGTNPAMIKQLARDGLVQKVAMDIKACPENYPRLVGWTEIEQAPSPQASEEADIAEKYKKKLEPVMETADFLLEGKIDYEFRTTVIRELHTEKDFREIGRWIKGAKAYYLQAYRESGNVILPVFSSYTEEELEHFASILRETIDLVEIRGA